MIRLLCLFAALGVAFAQQTPAKIVITFNANPANPTAVTRNVYRASAACGSTPAPTFAKLNATPVTTATYTDTVSIGTYCYYATAIVAGLESIPSNQVTGSALPLPETITISLQVAVNVTKDGVIIRAHLANYTGPTYADTPLEYTGKP